MQATSVEERLPLLDVLRGFALIGIFFANLVSFFGLYYLSFDQVQALPLLDKAVLFAIDALIEGKFYALFSLLLGIGFALQAERAQLRNSSFLPFWYRRMGVLLVIGLTHMCFIWYGDILTLYALLGLLMPFSLLLTNRQLATCIAALLVLPLFIHVVVALTEEAAFWSSLSRFAAGLQSDWGLAGRSNYSLFMSDTAREVWLANVLGAVQRPISYLLSGRYVQVLGFFMLGALFARTVLPLWREGQNISTKLWASSMSVGVVTGAIYAWTKTATGSYYGTDLMGLLQGLVMHVSCLTLMIGYVGAITWLWQQGRLQWLMIQLGIIGRMPLTSYITQTSFGVIVFYGYGFALMGEQPLSLIPVVVAIVIPLQWLFARFWLRSHDQGPLEALWRRLSYPS